MNRAVNKSAVNDYRCGSKRTAGGKKCNCKMIPIGAEKYWVVRENLDWFL